MLQQPCRAVPVRASPGLAVPIPQARPCRGCARIARGHRARRWHIHECAHPVVPALGSSEGACGGRGWWQPGLGAGPQVPPRLGGQLQADAQLSQLPFGIFPNVWGIPKCVMALGVQSTSVPGPPVQTMARLLKKWWWWGGGGGSVPIPSPTLAVFSAGASQHLCGAGFQPPSAAAGACEPSRPQGLPLL